jgi:RecB family endonuclease NucS
MVSEEENVSEAALRNYLKKIEKAYQIGNATEHTYRSVLQELIETLFPGITATNEPKHIKCGAPDFIITEKHIPLGYVETKNTGISLDQVEHGEQLKRYLLYFRKSVTQQRMPFKPRKPRPLAISAFTRCHPL